MIRTGVVGDVLVSAVVVSALLAPLGHAFAREGATGRDNEAILRDLATFLPPDRLEATRKLSASGQLCDVPRGCQDRLDCVEGCLIPLGKGTPGSVAPDALKRWTRAEATRERANSCRSFCDAVSSSCEGKCARLDQPCRDGCEKHRLQCRRQAEADGPAKCHTQMAESKSSSRGYGGARMLDGKPLRRCSEMTDKEQDEAERAKLGMCQGGFWTPFKKCNTSKDCEHYLDGFYEEKKPSLCSRGVCSF
jgi:hypothetical protein